MTNSQSKEPDPLRSGSFYLLILYYLSVINPSVFLFGHYDLNVYIIKLFLIHL